jgi:hypothetical protein
VLWVGGKGGKGGRGSSGSSDSDNDGRLEGTGTVLHSSYFG